MAPESSNDPDNDFVLFENSFNYSDYSSSFGAPMDDGVDSTELAFFTAHATSSMGSSAVTSTPAEDILQQSNNHPQVQGHQRVLDDVDGSKAMEGLSHNPGSSFLSLNNFNRLGHGSLSNNDWDPWAQQHNYTFNQVGTASSHHNNNISGPLDMACGFDQSLLNDFSNQVSWTADGPFVQVSQTPVYYSLAQETTDQRHFFTPIIEDQNAPRQMVTYPNIATTAMSAIETYNISSQEKNSQYSKTLDTCLDRPEEVPLNFRPCPHGPIANTDLDGNHANTTPSVSDFPWPPIPVAASFYQNCSSNTSQLAQTPRSCSGYTKTNDNGFDSTVVTNPVHSKRRRNLPILSAPAKSHPKAPHVSESLARSQHIYGPQQPLLRRSDRRKLTDKEKENAREVRENGSCVMCAIKNRKCDAKQICRNCQKMASEKDPKLVANHICIQGGILVFRQSIPDFYDIKSRLSLLPRILRGSWRTIMIGDRVTTNGTERALFPKKIPLVVRVQEYETCDMDTAVVWAIGSTKPAVVSYAIDPSTFPSAFDLDKWGRNLLSEYSELSDFRPYVMDKFLFEYLNAKPDLRHHDLVNLTIRLVSLSTWLFEGHPIISIDNVDNSSSLLFDISDDRIERRLSGVARSQLLLIAAEGFEATEKEILSTIDASMRPNGCNPQDTLILGLCLRRMALLYRFSLKRYKKFVIDSRIIHKREKSKAMYDVLTTAYSLVYRGTRSPYSTRWKSKDYLENHPGVLGNNRELSDLFREVVRYDKQYCENNREDEDDAHFRKLFLERREGGGPRA